MKTRHFLFALLTGFVMQSCGKEGTTSTPPPADSTHTDTTAQAEEPVINYELLAHDPSECDKLKDKEFCFQGLRFIQLGDTLAWRKFKVKDAVIKDTVFQDVRRSASGMDTVAWNVTMLSFKDGKIYLESDFDSGWLLNRFRVQTPSYVNREGAHVGMNVGELKTKYKNLYARTLNDEGESVVEIFADDHQFFHLPNQGIVPPNTGNFEITKVPDQAVITRIVVM